MTSDKLNLCQRHFLVLLLALSIGISGCAISPRSTDHKLRSDQMLGAQIRQAQLALEPSAPARIVYLGVALDDTTKAFRGDIDLVEKRLKEIDPSLVSIKLYNPPVTESLDLPFAVQENVTKVANEVLSRVRAQDKTVILLASHGNPGRLAVGAGGERFTAITPKFLDETLLRSFAEKPVLLIVSACYSGSFVEPLQAPSRLILTAASKDRMSFGCNFTAQTTFFIDGVFGSSWDQSKSLSEVFELAKESIAAREKRQTRGLPSQPQLSVGSQVSRWLNQAIFTSREQQ